MNLAIQGHLERGKEVIEILEMLGGVNTHNLYGDENYAYYTIDSDKEIKGGIYVFGDEQLCHFTLEEFEEKFPYKVGDKVKAWINGYHSICNIQNMQWDGIANEIKYKIQDYWYSAMTLQPYKEEAMEERKSINLNELEPQPEALAKETTESLNKLLDEDKVFGYKVDDVVFINDTGWIRITNKLWDCYNKEHVYDGIGIINELEYKNIRHQNVTGKLQLGDLKYSNNADGVRSVNSITDDIMISQITNKVSEIELNPDVCDNEIELKLGDYEIEVRDGKTYAILKKPTYPKTYIECAKILESSSTVYIDGYKAELFEKFQKLLICRDAYWKIAGEQMGLGKAWEPDWSNSLNKCCLLNCENRIIRLAIVSTNTILAFPTEEMRDAFYENFKDLIEQCKELL